MKILYDHQIFSSQRLGGVSRYFMELFKQFGSMKDIEFELDIKFSNNYYIQNNPDFDCRTFFAGSGFRGRNRILELLNRPFTIRHLKKRDYDLFHPTFYDPYFLKYLGKKPFVLTVYDLIHEIYPELPNAARETANRKKLINAASMIIAISQNTKNDLLKYYAVDADKIKVIYLGAFDTCSRPADDSPSPDCYFLFVGCRRYYKNFRFVLEAFAEIAEKHNSLCLLCAGGGSFSKDENIMICRLGLTGKVVQRDFSDAGLEHAYSRAVAFIFPSLYEGFGMPILEAFKNACPCLLANASCFPEIARDAALFFNPRNQDDLSEKMSELLVNDDLRQDLATRGKNRLNCFSWKKTAEQTIEVYRQVLAKSGKAGEVNHIVHVGSVGCGSEE